MWCLYSYRTSFGYDQNQQYNYTKEQVRWSVETNQRTPSVSPHSPWRSSAIKCLPLHLLQELPCRVWLLSVPLLVASTHKVVQECNRHDGDFCLKCYWDSCIDAARPRHDDPLSNHDGPYTKAKEPAYRPGDGGREWDNCKTRLWTGRGRLLSCMASLQGQI